MEGRLAYLGQAPGAQVLPTVVFAFDGATKGTAAGAFNCRGASVQKNGGAMAAEVYKRIELAIGCFHHNDWEVGAKSGIDILRRVGRRRSGKLEDGCSA